MKRHIWRKLANGTDRCARRYCKAKRKRGGRKYLYQNVTALSWQRTYPACTGESTADR